MDGDLMTDRSVTTNSSVEIVSDIIENPGVRYTLVVLHVISILLASAGNGFLLVFILRHWKQTHRNVTAILILNLLVCDFINVTMHQPMKLVDILVYHEQNLTYCQVSGYFSSFFSGVAFWLMAAIGQERFLLICLPFKAKQFITLRNTIITISCIWVGVAVVMIPIPIGFANVLSVHLKNGVAKFCMINLDNKGHFRADIYFIFMFLLFFIAPLIILLISYIRIFQALHVKVPGSKQANDAILRAQAQRKSLAKVMVSIAVIFVVSNGPIWLAWVVALCGHEIKHNPIFSLLLLELFAMISPVMNPIVYSIRYRTFQKGVTHGGSIYSALRQISINRTSTLRSDTPFTSRSSNDLDDDDDDDDSDSKPDLSPIAEEPPFSIFREKGKMKKDSILVSHSGEKRSPLRIALERNASNKSNTTVSTRLSDFSDRNSQITFSEPYNNSYDRGSSAQRSSSDVTPSRPRILPKSPRRTASDISRTHGPCPDIPENSVCDMHLVERDDSLMQLDPVKNTSPRSILVNRSPSHYQPTVNRIKNPNEIPQSSVRASPIRKSFPDSSHQQNGYRRSDSDLKPSSKLQRSSSPENNIQTQEKNRIPIKQPSSARNQPIPIRQTSLEKMPRNRPAEDQNRQSDKSSTSRYPMPYIEDKSQEKRSNEEILDSYPSVSKFIKDRPSQNTTPHSKKLTAPDELLNRRSTPKPLKSLRQVSDPTAQRKTKAVIQDSSPTETDPLMSAPASIWQSNGKADRYSITSV